MQIQSMHFKARAHQALADEKLQSVMKRFGSGFVEKRAAARAEFGEDLFETLRTVSAGIRDRSLANLDVWLRRFEEEAERRGATVLWAEDGAEVRRLVLEIAARHGLKKAIKSKSMVSEEAGLNEAYYSHCSFRSPTQPVPAEINPRNVMNRLFGKSDEPGKSTQILNAALFAPKSTMLKTSLRSEAKLLLKLPANFAPKEKNTSFKTVIY